MSVKVVTRGIRNERSVNSQPRNTHHNPTVQKPTIVFHDNSKPSPLLSDKNEFPSLIESSGIVSNNSFCTERTFRYSDKLKSSSPSGNQSSTLECFKSESSVASNSYDQHRNRDSNTDDENWRRQGKNNLKRPVRNINQNDSNESQLRKFDVNSSRNVPKKPQNEWFKERNSLPKQLIRDRNGQPREKQLTDASRNSRCSASNKTSTSGTSFNSTINQSHSRTMSTSGSKQTPLKETDNQDGQNESKSKKKKRKSKVKRQVAVQSGKITVLTPEVHLKILNQTSALNVQSSNPVLTDINDEEEYPELGKTMLPTNQKDICLKKQIPSMSLQENIEVHPNVLSEENVVTYESPISDMNEPPVNEKKGKKDTKTTVHLKDPITLSFYDMLISKNPKPKVRVIKEEADASAMVESTKIKIKKSLVHPHNLLDSSSPMIKRGKERENPKAKKPSMLKKIILSDRKARKEQFLLLKSNNLAENPADDNEFLEEDVKNEVIVETTVPDENYNVSPCQLDENLDEAGFLSSDNNDSLQDELNVTFDLKNVSGPVEQLNAPPVDAFCKNVKSENCLDNSKENLPISEVPSYEKGSFVKSEEVAIIAPVSSSNVSLSDSLLSGLINNVSKPDACYKEKAAKILLHTRNFREYCNHLISKDIDDAVYALLDDLAKFQDRLHQKDPVKARMKKRMIYGVKEVKKHIKLRKLKCIIIAVDIENVESQGGLNDVLNDIKLLAADHHIPCVFALSRKVLGKVCRKPVPVSCVGVFNYEGSEANFKKMVELQTQSKADYNEFFNKLFLKLTEEETTSLLKAKKEAPETLHSIRVNILNDFFMQSKIDDTKSDDADLNVKDKVEA